MRNNRKKFHWFTKIDLTNADKSSGYCQRPLWIGWAEFHDVLFSRRKWDGETICNAYAKGLNSIPQQADFLSTHVSWKGGFCEYWLVNTPKTKNCGCTRCQPCSAILFLFSFFLVAPSKTMSVLVAKEVGDSFIQTRSLNDSSCLRERLEGAVKSSFTKKFTGCFPENPLRALDRQTSWWFLPWRWSLLNSERRKFLESLLREGSHQSISLKNGCIKAFPGSIVNCSTLKPPPPQ